MLCFLYSLEERFALSEVAQTALCCRPLRKTSELYNQPDALSHGELLFLSVCLGSLYCARDR